MRYNSNCLSSFGIDNGYINRLYWAQNCLYNLTGNSRFCWVDGAYALLINCWFSWLSCVKSGAYKACNILFACSCKFMYLKLNKILKFLFKLKNGAIYSSG